MSASGRRASFFWRSSASHRGRSRTALSIANPLDDLATLRKPLGVMHDGRWYDAAALQALLDGVAKEYDDAAPPR